MYFQEYNLHIKIFKEFQEFANFHENSKKKQFVLFL